MGIRTNRFEIENAIATPTGPNGSPATYERTMAQELISWVTNMSRPLPWLVNNQADAFQSGRQRAAIVNPPKITEACSHLGPSKTRVSGRARARHKPVKKNPANAIASYRGRNVDRYRSGWDCKRDNAGMKTALIGLRNCSRGRMSKALA